MIGSKEVPNFGQSLSQSGSRFIISSKHMLKSFAALLSLAAILAVSLPIVAHVGNHPSIHDTVAGIAEKFHQQFSESQLKALTAYQIEQLLSVQEKEILGSEHITFKVNVPVELIVVRDRALKSEPFWIRERDFKLTGVTYTVSTEEFDVWTKDFEAGQIGLGVNSLSGGAIHYVILLRPKNPTDKIEVTDLYPGQLRVEAISANTKPFVDNATKLKDFPTELSDCLIVRTENGSRDDAKLVDYFKWTLYPASPKPDQIVLTWSDDPKTTQTIQWRTSTAITQGKVTFQEKARFNRFKSTPLVTTSATTETLESMKIVNDPDCARHTATLTGLKPDTTYVYSVGDGTDEGWSELSEFTTAPDTNKPFSFIYMGDAQNGLDRWGTLVRNAFRERPDAAFYIMAGDLVNRGNDRDDWDSLFYNAASIYNQRQLVPAIGNHENQGGHPTLYLKNFTLPNNGPTATESERAYSFEYSNALFVILDSNLKPEDQAEWLDKTLAASTATWKFAVYHHPAYSSAANRDNSGVRTHWLPLFDKHHVDMALQGHDHAYLRTYPMKGGQAVNSPKDGTVYVVSVSGTKMYDQDAQDYIEFGMTNTATYQVLDIQISGDRLVYRAYDIDGGRRDELIIEKSAN
jgi:hypothetical protein